MENINQTLVVDGTTVYFNGWNVSHVFFGTKRFSKIFLNLMLFCMVVVPVGRLFQSCCNLESSFIWEIFRNHFHKLAHFQPNILKNIRLLLICLIRCPFLSLWLLVLPRIFLGQNQIHIKLVIHLIPWSPYFEWLNQPCPYQAWLFPRCFLVPASHVEFLSGCGAAAGSSWNMEELSPTKTFWTIHFFKTTHSLLVTKWLPIYIYTHIHIYIYKVHVAHVVSQHVWGIWWD